MDNASLAESRSRRAVSRGIQNGFPLTTREFGATAATPRSPA